MATLKITGGESLDGEYEMVLPSTLDMMEYRKRLGITPSELGTIMAEGAMESIAVIAYATLRKNGNTAEDLADLVVRLPMGAISTADEEEEGLPPVSSPEDGSREISETASSGKSTGNASGTLASIPRPTGGPTSPITAGSDQRISQS